MRRRHLENARRRIRRAATATAIQDVDDQLDAIDEALGRVDRWADARRERLERVCRQLSEIEAVIEAPLDEDLRQARASIRAYGRRRGE